MNKTSIDLIKVKEIGSAEIIETEIGDLKKYLEEIWVQHLGKLSK